LKRLEDGSSVKDWEDADKETDVPLQLTVKEVNFEDERFKEQAAPPLSEEFPIGTTVFFLGEHAYGVVAQVHEIVGETLSVTLAVRLCPLFAEQPLTRH
jgi:5'-3' exoribonuclease 1